MSNSNTAAAKAQQQADAIRAIANASQLIRNAVAAALPVAPEQYITISVPGTVIDTTAIGDGGSYVYDATTSPFIPDAVQQAQAKLVDNMVPLANVMLGNTGKSVARSYNAALNFLVPKKATIGTGNQIRSPRDPLYDDAIKKLTTKDDSGNTLIETYIIKQLAWSKAQDAWDQAKIDARQQAAKDNPNDNQAAVQQFNDWNTGHFRRYKEETQARFMDWVVNGNKYTVENYFGIVDVDSVMARIEASKEAMRNTVIVDADGASELQKVNLTPRTWATMCKNKADGFYTRNGNFSADQVQAELARLQKLQLSLQALQQELAAKKYPIPNAQDATADALTAAQAAVKQAYVDLYDAQGIANSTETPTDAQITAVDDKRRALATAQDAWENVELQHVKFMLSSPDGATWIANVLTTIADQITKLQGLAGTKSASSAFSLSTIVSAHTPPAQNVDGGAAAGGSGDGGGTTSGNNVAAAGDEFADPIFNLAGGTQPNGPPADPWTKITASFSAKDQTSTATQSSWGMSVSAKFGWGLWSAGGSYSHESSDTDFKSAMASCDVSVSFSALVVNIDRPWLYGELFNDFEIDVAQDAKLSPGAEQLHTWLADQAVNPASVSSLGAYAMFPAYPTSFIVAADVKLDFSGKTEAIQKHFHSTSNTASASFGWGPFSASGSYHSSSSRSDFHMNTTATGVSIEFAAPQIIAWVSQILPALPRRAGFEPMVQNTIPPS